jgi:hypothetical protein
MTSFPGRTGFIGGTFRGKQELFISKIRKIGKMTDKRLISGLHSSLASKHIFLRSGVEKSGKSGVYFGDFVRPHY